MKLIKARIQNFRSIEDTGEFDINNLTCLVGKNEAGKTAILQALEAQRAYSGSTASYDITKDYPRRFVTQFDQRHPDGEADVCTTTWKLEKDDIALIESEFGEGVVTGELITISSGYGYSGSKWAVPIDNKKSIENLMSKFKLDASERNLINKAATAKEVYQIFQPVQRTDKQEALFQQLSKYRDHSINKKVIDILSPKTPKFVYVSHYDRMAGQISVDNLLKQKNEGKPTAVENEIFLSLLNLAGTSLDDLKDSQRYEELKAKCEAASNTITEKIFQYWSQNDALDVQIEFSPGRPEDPAPFNSGTVVRARVWNGNHRASVPFSERSAGFVWFFSFLVKFAEIRNEMGNVIILLDEPGLTLHGKAQADLLRYVEEELLPNHQVIFSTHSPFLVPAHRLADVRVVEDVLEYKKGQSRPIVHGTKVLKDVLETDKDTLFPLQGALGYDLCQTLFVGKQTLLVEGPSDILYIQVASAALKKRGRISLDPRWTLCPSGGIDKIQTFISLFSGNHLEVAVLTDQGVGDKSKIERLKRSEILKTGWFYSVADFLGRDEADIEDLIESTLMVEIVNGAFALSGKDLLDIARVDSADTSTTRNVKKLAAAFRTLSPSAPQFDHFTPAMWVLNNATTFDQNSKEVNETLDRFENVFKTFNSLLA